MTVGNIEVICGPMFSGKTEELIRRMRRVKISLQSYKVFKPELDDRYGIEQVTSHNGDNFPAIVISNSQQILDYCGQLLPDVVGIEEAQFLDSEIVSIVRFLSQNGTRVIVAGLDTDFRGEPFGAMPQLLSIADEVTKLTAICNVCKDHKARRTQRIIDGNPAFYEDPQILVGAKESYEPRCSIHHKVPRKEAIVDSSS